MQIRRRACVEWTHTECNKPSGARWKADFSAWHTKSARLVTNWITWCLLLFFRVYTSQPETETARGRGSDFTVRRFCSLGSAASAEPSLLVRVLFSSFCCQLKTICHVCFTHGNHEVKTLRSDLSLHCQRLFPARCHFDKCTLRLHDSTFTFVLRSSITFLISRQMNFPASANNSTANHTNFIYFSGLQMSGMETYFQVHKCRKTHTRPRTYTSGWIQISNIAELIR